MSELSVVVEQIKNRIMITDILSPFVPIQRRGNRIVGLCPFHKEKSPSFNIDNVKGSYHCFGCGQHGDHFSFLIEHQGMTFTEALKHLAEKAGVQLPEKTSATMRIMNKNGAYENGATESKQEKLFVLMEQACQWYQEKLNVPAAQFVRDYLTSRSLPNAMIDRFRLGFAPEMGSLKEALIQKGATKTDLLEVGLITDKGTDRFRGRLIFPITDAKGRVIAFGGRALSKDQMPKYLNSPDTPLFHKSMVLYAQPFAFKAVTREIPPLVVEGYMDVISLHQFGFETAVAPLGTAFSDDHMKRLWQRHPSPIFCFDGDEAGRKAAFRVAQRVFPLLKPHFFVQFCFLPEGEDPDTYLKTFGKTDFDALLKKTRTLTDAIWNGYIQKFSITPQASPEDKTILKKALMEHVAEIADTDLKQFFQRDFNDKLYHFFSIVPKRQRVNETQGFTAVLKTDMVQTLKKIKKNHLAAKILLATLKNNPTLVERVYEFVIGLDELPQDLFEFRNFLCEQFYADAAALATDATQKGHQNILHELDALNLRATAPFALPNSDNEIVFQGWMDVWQQYHKQSKVRKETTLMKARLKNTLDEKSWEQWQQIKTAFTFDVND